ncbi:phosphoribosyltransferase [Maribacter arcticus]|uniref:Predicted phosphoribosyltransferase n=1 Tax=Maribacter arcticus TaxID=561365 RepID=A0A1T4ZVL1_9FLAO|nr:phosphoribosyltransferase family protein [Maribacter arcticus]SKB26383.1 Predicted phosphoribosyltransferase [Maribacter arcticus]|tara:strand:+ start:356 stop:997 length:642 start_codon:yes stop_codon:yes gene_type:complete
MFEDRNDAGTQLAKKLTKFKEENVVVLAIPRGGLPVGAQVAKSLQAPLDVVLTKKIGYPTNKEYAIGAISLESIVLTNAMGIEKSYIDQETARIRKTLRERYNQYYKHQSPANLKNKTIIIVDDGVATGNTLLATIELVYKQNPSKIIIAIPVAPASAIYKISNTENVDEVICILIPDNFRAVGQFYKNFEQVTDQKAIQILEKTNSKKTLDL